MSQFIENNCAPNEYAHTKVGDCATFEGTPKGFILHHKDMTFSLDKEKFNQELKEGITALGIKRITPILKGVTDYQPNGGDVRTAQEGFGPAKPNGTNAKSVVYVINEGGLCLLKELNKFNAKDLRILEVDDNDKVYGPTVAVDGEPRIRGYAATTYAIKRDNTGSQGGGILFNVYYGANYKNEENTLSAIGLTQELEGLTGVVLQRVDTGKARVVVACSGDDLTSTLADILAEPTLYVDDKGVAPTTVSYDPATSLLTFAPASGKYKIVDAEKLAAANIEGFEGENSYTDLT